MDNPIFIFLLGQTFGIIALICTVISMQLAKKRPLMVLQTLSEVFIVLQYWVKGAITGSLLSIVSFIRNVIFTRYDKRRAPVFVLLTIYAIMILLTVFSWAGPLSLLPLSGSIIYAFFLWYGKVEWIRFGNAVGNTPYLIYTILTGNHALFIMTAIEIASAWIGFFRFLKKPSTNRKKSSRKKRH